MPPRDIRSGVRRLFRLALFRPTRAAADADAELEAVLAAHVDYLCARGVPLEIARAEALRALGESPDEVRSHLRRSAGHRERTMRLREWMDEALTDARHAVRSFRRSPALTAAAVVTLALAIGANTAIFSAVSAVVLRPLPFADPDRLVTIGEDNPDFQWRLQDAAPANFLDWKEQVAAFRGMAAYENYPGTATLNGRGEPRLLTTTAATGNFFEVLGVRPVLGQSFTDAQTWATSGPPSVMLSYRAWRDVFGADTALVGRTIQFGGRSVQVAGILPRSLVIPGLDIDVWTPMGWNPADRQRTWFRRAHFVRVVARLAPNATMENANASLQSVVGRLKQEYPATNAHMGASVESLQDFLVGKARLPLLVSLVGVGALLLIATANVANLMLVRAAGRERDAAIRLALGAGRARLVRQALTESVVLAAAGGALGLAVGWLGTRQLTALEPPDLLPVRDVSMNGAVLGYALAATMLSALLFGVAPALWMRRRVAAEVLREEGRSSVGTVRVRRWGDALLVAQVAIALTLMLGAGLLVRSYLLLRRVDPGFDASHVLAVNVNLPGIRFDSVSKVIAFYDELEQRARTLPGVERAALVSQVPLTSPPWSSEFAVAGHDPMARGSEVVHREVSPDYHLVMHVPLRGGRLFENTDRRGAPYVVLVNESLARHYFSGQNPVGQRVTFDRVPDSTSTWRTIVGVVGDERQAALGDEARPEFYAPYQQESRTAMTLVVRTRGDPTALAPAIRRVISQLDPALAISRITTMEDIRSAAMARDRFLTALLLAFAGVGVLLGIVGVYGVVAQLARGRTREIGIRIALGARATSIQWLVVRHGVGLTLVGTAIGIVVALQLTRVMRVLLYHVTPGDSVTFVVVPLLVVAAAGAASWLPAARASLADPAEVLRAE